MDNKKMPEEARKALNAYRKEWRKKNPDKVRETQIRYWMKRAERMKEEGTLK